MRRIDERGVSALLAERIARWQAEGVQLHVSFDVDFLDPAVAPGTGTVVPGGASYREAHLVMEMLCDSGLVGSVDVVELNPFLDERGRTAVAPPSWWRASSAAPCWTAGPAPCPPPDPMPGDRPMLDSAGLIDLETRLGASNYQPLDVVLTEGRGVWVTDVEGNRYLDCLAAYSAVNQGHCHPTHPRRHGRAGRPA